MIHALVTAAGLTGEGRYRQAAEEALAGVAGLATQAPRFAGWSLAAAEALAAGPLEVAVVGPEGPARDALERTARAAPGVTVVVADAGDNGIPLLDARGPVDGEPAAYVCREMVCDRPVTHRRPELSRRVALLGARLDHRRRDYPTPPRGGRAGAR